MFSDTHCHLSHLVERGENLAELFRTMADEQFPFVLDIGTKPGDFQARLAKIRAVGDMPDFLHFSCGLWPDGEIIAHREESLKILEADVRTMLELATTRARGLPHVAATPDRAATPVSLPVAATPDRAATPVSLPVAALGECGLDRYWNGPAAAERVAAVSDDGPGTTDLHGEEELFAAQLDMARAYNLAVIVHSRESFEPTLAVIRNADYDKGVIHCFAYDIEEARAFLDRGWYISFPGNVTWAKKEADRERVARLIRFVPRDRLLLETDAPYLTPAPHRGKTNTPLYIRHTYERVADILGLQSAALASLVHANALSLFALKNPT